MPVRLRGKTGAVADVVERYERVSADFLRRLRAVAPPQWTGPTPCAEWNVRALVNHMARGNHNYAELVAGGTAAQFLRLRDVDALGADPVEAFAGSVRACAEAFARPGALDRVLDYPLGAIPGRQALAVRIADSLIHTWDLARAIGADEQLDPDLVAWVGEHVDDIYSGLAERPAGATHRFFAPPIDVAAGAARQDQLLGLFGRVP